MSRNVKTHRPEGRLEHRSIIVIDIAGSGRWHNRELLLAREVLTAAVHTALHDAGITKPAIEHTGDGMILLFPAHISKIDLLDPVIPSIAEHIGTHNATANKAPHIQLRMAVHAGEVHRDPNGWVGTDLITTCRLVNGKPLYQELRRPPHPNLVVVVSDLIYQAVVRHHYRGIDPADYTPTHIHVKETATLAWLYTPHNTTPAQQDRISAAGWRVFRTG
jgi:class 3 adenylate cyclase